MRTITRKQGAFHNETFIADLSDIDKTIDDVEDIFFTIKEDYDDADNSLLLKTQLTGGIATTGKKRLKVIVNMTANDTSNFIADKQYIAGLFFKFTGDATADENVSQLFYFKVIKDMLNDN